ncbi:kinase-like domain-containing protein [Ephemerocybe angulata]|uniref:Kinase-like domain-containing protein n=1 Tax=Ephemerocybe angulata TaxID=980116 RepID=A0A8H6HV87_9AGAR|nr:kinase-like domain-containing protein [Tulosesus angulatus]
MPRCSGCSKPFPLLPTARRCGACARRAAGESVWPQCVHCGATYEFLDEPFICGVCVDYEGPGGTAEIADNAVRNPANPKTHSRHKAAAPESDDEIDINEDQALKRRAAEIMGSLSSSYARASSRGAPGVKVAPPKVKGGQTHQAPPSKKPVQRINVRIDKIVNLGVGKRASMPPGFSWARILEIPEDTKMKEVLKRILEVVDRETTKAHDVRVYFANQMVLMWATSKTEVSAEYLKLPTLGDFWRAVSHNLNYVKATDRKINRVDLYVNVKYNPEGGNGGDDENDDDSEANLDKSKAAKSKTTYETRSGPGNQRKRTRIAASGGDAYHTEVSTAIGVTYEVEKMQLVAVNGNPKQIKWVTSSTLHEVVIENTSFASGETKHVYKLTMGGNMFAAKRFYNIGQGAFAPVSNEDNLQNIKDEVLRQYVAKLSAEKFMEAARSDNISIYDLCFEDPMVLVVKRGADKGQAFLVDFFYEDADLAMSKFSGTDEAGHHADLVGRTSDAWAHFSYWDSGETIVFVDIQGIDTAMLPSTTPRNGSSEGLKLILFDIMIHSKKKRYGLGDKGPEGLQRFKEQHTCNSICRKLELPALSGAAANNDDDIFTPKSTISTDTAESEPDAPRDIPAEENAGDDET